MKIRVAGVRVCLNPESSSVPGVCGGMVPEILDSARAAAVVNCGPRSLWAKPVDM